MKKNAGRCLMLFVLIFTNSLLAQVETSAQMRVRGFNTPPSATFVKVDVNDDFSHKLSRIPAEVPADYVEPKFVNGQTWDEYLSSETISQEERTYYQEAKAYFHALSPKVKIAFEIHELWHIYYFNPQMKQHLLTIN